MAGKFYFPSAGASGDIYQTSPLLQSYSTRLFGSPPQMTNLCDMRIHSQKSDGSPGEVGDYYLDLLQDACVAYFVVGRALFSGGKSSRSDIVRIVGNYKAAFSRADAAGVAVKESGDGINMGNGLEDEITAAEEQSSLMTSINVSGEGEYAQDRNGLFNLDGVKGECGKLAQWMGGATELLATSLSAEQPMYTFDSDWPTYISRVKMMINTAVFMLGLQDAVILEDGRYLKIGLTQKSTDEKDVWANYRFIYPSEGMGETLQSDNQNGETSQYVSFMIEPTTFDETFTNQTTESQIYSSFINQGSSVGRELAFISGSSTGIMDDIVDLGESVTDIARNVMSKLGGNVGRFTASIAGGMTKSYLGQHYIFPKIFDYATGPGETMSMTIRLSASGGDLYSELVDILVPLFFIYGMMLPGMSNNNAAAYAYPPIVQCNIPGIWGTRLGMITNVTVKKEGWSDANSFPMSLLVTLTVTDLTNHLVATGMNKPAEFLNNASMFDYIAQRCGVDKYRPNGTVRLLARAALATNWSGDFFYHMKSAALSDWHSIENKIFGAAAF